MGMFDELRVEYPLPDGWNPEGHVFQTKDTPAQWLARYVLNAWGIVLEEETGKVVPFHGPLTFATGNACGSAPWGVETRDDQPEWQAEYTALFDHGHLLRIEGAWHLCAPSRPHILRADWDAARARWDALHPAPPRPHAPLPLTAAQAAALKAAIERLLAAYWRTQRMLDEEVDACCDALAAWLHEKETP